MRPAFLECTACGKRRGVTLANLCDCGAPLLVRYDLESIHREDLLPRRDLWRYAPLLPLDATRVESRGEGGTPLHRLTRIGSGGRVARLKVAALHVKDEGLNPTGTFKARGMAVAVPMAQALGAGSVLAPTAGNAGAALALYAAAYGLEATILMTPDAPAEAKRKALAMGAKVLQIEGDITDAGRVAQQIAAATGAFNVATLREPYRVEGKKTMLLEIWEDLGGMPDWILFPTGGGTGVAGIWKALGELRELGWYEGAWPRIGLVQAEGCAPLVRAWTQGRESAEPWTNPTTAAAGLRVPATLADRIVLRAIRETRGACVAVSEDEMAVAAANLAALEGLSACLEGAATLAGLRRLHDEGVIRPEDRVVLVNTGVGRGSEDGSPADVPAVRSAEEAMARLGLASRPQGMPG
ncbi:MAG TPA: threonine synthase [Thermoplasmata archaeon]|nr:threonine synthase [Thermoplasmata archaeon]